MKSEVKVIIEGNSQDLIFTQSKTLEKNTKRNPKTFEPLHIVEFCVCIPCPESVNNWHYAV